MKRKLLVASGIYLLLGLLGTIVAIAQSLPYDHPFWGTGDPDQVLRDWFIGSGTALSAPAIMFVFLVVSMFLLNRARPAYTIGVVAIALIGFVSTVGSLGESVTWEAVTSGTFDPLKAAQAWFIFVTAMFMWAFGITEILNLRQGMSEIVQTATLTARKQAA